MKYSKPGDLYKAAMTKKHKKLNPLGRITNWPKGINDIRLNKAGTVGTEPIQKGNRQFTEIKAGRLGKLDIPMGKNKTHRKMSAVERLRMDFSPVPGVKRYRPQIAERAASAIRRTLGIKSRTEDVTHKLKKHRKMHRKTDDSSGKVSKKTHKKIQFKKHRKLNQGSNDIVAEQNMAGSKAGLREKRHRKNQRALRGGLPSAFRNLGKLRNPGRIQLKTHCKKAHKHGKGC